MFSPVLGVSLHSLAKPMTDEMLALARGGITRLLALQQKALPS